jgi:hypothetical protein
MNLDSKAELRHAIRRIIAVLRGTGPEVTVQRRDLELLVVLAATKTGIISTPGLPQFHPEQR